MSEPDEQVVEPGESVYIIGSQAEIDQQSKTERSKVNKPSKMRAAIVFVVVIFALLSVLEAVPAPQFGYGGFGGGYPGYGGFGGGYPGYGGFGGGYPGYGGFRRGGFGGASASASSSASAGGFGGGFYG